MFAWLTSQFRRKAPHPKPQYVFTDEDRENAEISRLYQSIREQKKKALRRRLERLKDIQEEEELEEQIAELEEESYDGEEEEEEDHDGLGSPDALFGMLLKKLMSAQPPSTVLSGNNGGVRPQEPTGKRDYTDAELGGMLSKVPRKYLEELKKFDDAAIVEQIQLQAPDFFMSASEDSILRAVKLIKA